MENVVQALKAVADEARLRIVVLLLKRNYCVGALARRLGISEAGVSQHLKVLREAGFLIGEKHGYFMHYEVDREKLKSLAADLERMAEMEREPCKPDEENCRQAKRKRCHTQRDGREQLNAK